MKHLFPFLQWPRLDAALLRSEALAEVSADDLARVQAVLAQVARNIEGMRRG